MSEQCRSCGMHSTSIQENLIHRVTEALRSWGRPQKSLARAVGISEKHLSQILSGKAWPTPGVWDRLIFEAEHWPPQAQRDHQECPPPPAVGSVGGYPNQEGA